MLGKRNCFIVIFFILLLSACGGGGEGSEKKYLERIEVTPNSSSIANGTTQQYVAMGLYSDGSTQNLSSSAIWETSDETIATISENGLLTSVGEGQVTITAISSEISGNTLLSVTAEILTSLEVTPNNLSIANGTTQQFVAMGLYSDGSTQNLSTQVTWETSDETIAMVSADGVATSYSEGDVTITALFSGISVNVMMSVTEAILTSIEVTPKNLSIKKGINQQFIATGLFSDGTTQNLTTQVVWSTSDQAVAIVSNAAGTEGIVSGTGGGSCLITAILSSIESIPVDITVTIDPNSPLSLTITAEPNVILDDGVDISNLFVIVQPSDPSGSIADGTLVNFSADPNIVNFEDSTVGTTLGQLSNQLTSESIVDTYSAVTVNASIQDESISNTVGITVVSNFSSIFTTNHSRSGVCQLGYYQAGTQFSLSITNSSNRTFNLHSLEATNGGVLITSTFDSSLLSSYDIDGGETVGITITLNSNQLDQGFNLKYFLSDSVTGQDFTVSYSFEIMPSNGTIYF